MLLDKKYPVCKYYWDCILFVLTFQCLQQCHHRQQLLKVRERYLLNNNGGNDDDDDDDDDDDEIKQKRLDCSMK